MFDQARMKKELMSTLNRLDYYIETSDSIPVLEGWMGSFTGLCVFCRNVSILEEREYLDLHSKASSKWYHRKCALLQKESDEQLAAFIKENNNVL